MFHFLIVPLQVHCYEKGPPWGTRALSLAIVLLSLPVLIGKVELEPLFLSWTDMQPHQLLTSVLVHADWTHLVFNLFFLHLYGKAVEGAVGTRAFLVLCAAIALLSNLVELALFAGTEGGSLGASGIIMGLLAAAFLVAPTAETTLLARRIMRSSTLVTLRLPVLAGGVFALEALRTLALSGAPSTPALHLIGMVCGLVLAYLGLRLGWLDCDGWDRLSRRKAQDDQDELLQNGRLTCPRCRERLPHGAVLCANCGKHAGRA